MSDNNNTNCNTNPTRKFYKIVKNKNLRVG